MLCHVFSCTCDQTADLIGPSSVPLRPQESSSPLESLGKMHISPRQRNPAVDKLLQPCRATRNSGSMAWPTSLEPAHPHTGYQEHPPPQVGVSRHLGFCPPYRKHVRGHSAEAGRVRAGRELLNDLAGLITRQWEPLSFPGFSQGQLQQLNRHGLKYYGPQTSPQKMKT